ncbi:MAG: ABC transporter permease [Alphaproteobacteria bacterium]|nr:ABC transporter permease [Alphaproteobacteria bacterium]
MSLDRYIRNKRSKAALFALAFILLLSFMAEIIANDKPIILKYQGEYFFPIAKVYTDARFGGDFPTEANYKDTFIKNNIEENGFMLMPLIEFSFNTVDYELNQPFPAPPSWRHPLGTDEEGRDIVARLLYGIRLSFLFAFVLTAISSVLGIFVGAVQGYFGGKTDIILQRVIEIWDSMPQMFVLIIVASVFIPTFWTLLIILLLFSWTELTGMVRAEFLRARNFEYVKAAKAIGVGNFRIMWRHILPNALVTTITFVPFILAGGIVALTALDFLGLGLGDNYPSLGDLVRQGKDNLQAPWIGLSIFFVLSAMLTALIFIGEGVRDAMDKRKR